MRKTILLSICLFAFSVLSALAEDWNQFLGPNGNNISSETGLIDRFPADGPKILWRKEIGNGYSTPVVVNGKLVVFYRVKDEEIIECLDAETGEPLWEKRYPATAPIPQFGGSDGPKATPVLTDEYCYVLGAAGELFCLKTDDGEEVWQRNIQKEWNVPPPFFGSVNSPLLFGGNLIVTVGGQPNSGIVSLDAKTGETVWEHVGQENWDGVTYQERLGKRTVEWDSSGFNACHSGITLADIHGKTRLFTLMRQGLVILDPATGKVDISFYFRANSEYSVNAINPVIVGSKVFISNGYFKTGSVLLDVHPDLSGVDEVWRGLVLEVLMETPVYHNGYLYAFSGFDPREVTLRCVEFNTGELQWQADGEWSGEELETNQRRGRSEKQFGRGSAILADEKLIILSDNGTLVFANTNPEKYEELARFSIPDFVSPCWTPPALSNKKLYLRNEHQLVCIDLAE